MKKFLNLIGWEQCNFFEMQCQKWNTVQKMKYRANFLIFLILYFSNFLISKCDLRTWLRNFSCILLISNSMVSRSILVVFEKFTRACFLKIALETSLLPIQINQIHSTLYCTLAPILFSCIISSCFAYNIFKDNLVIWLRSNRNIFIWHTMPKQTKMETRLLGQKYLLTLELKRQL
jgi:hypothetical protein